MDGTDALCTVLEDETRLCGELSRVLRDERRALVALAPDELLARIAERRTLQEELGNVAGRRRGLVAKLGARLGIEAPTATALVAALPAADGTRLRGRVRVLRQALLETRGLERQNGVLARAGLDATGEMLQALAALVPGMRYGADARIAAPAPVERVGRRA